MELETTSTYINGGNTQQANKPEELHKNPEQVDSSAAHTCTPAPCYTAPHSLLCTDS